jgi:lipid-A-disaccharide synthase
VYYISPQIWAWRPGRLKTIRAVADRVLVIFPFEEQIYRDGGVPVEFVGHPLVELARPSATREVFLARIGLSPDAPTVAVLPGSRPSEVGRILPDLVLAAGRIRSRVARAQFVIARAPSLDDELFTIVEGLGVSPMVVVYRVSPLTYCLGRRLVKLDTFAMVNLIAGRRIVPELIQDAFTPEAVADEAVSILTDTPRADRIREGLARVRERLGGPGASRRAAEAVLRVAAHAIL